MKLEETGRVYAGSISETGDIAPSLLSSCGRFLIAREFLQNCSATISLGITISKETLKTFSESLNILITTFKSDIKNLIQGVSLTLSYYKELIRTLVNTITLSIINSSGRLIRLTQGILLTSGLKKNAGRSLLIIVNLSDTTKRTITRTIDVIPIYNVCSFTKHTQKTNSAVLQITLSTSKSLIRRILESVGITDSVIRLRIKHLVESIGINTLVSKRTNKNIEASIIVSENILRAIYKYLTTHVHVLPAYGDIFNLVLTAALHITTKANYIRDIIKTVRYTVASRVKKFTSTAKIQNQTKVEREIEGAEIFIGERSP